MIVVEIVNTDPCNPTAVVLDDPARLLRSGEYSSLSGQGDPGGVGGRALGSLLLLLANLDGREL